jgi:hypothetical protein
LDEDGELLEGEDYDVRFKQARAGDHLMVPFQCELCHFCNIMKQNPEANIATDVEMLDIVRRANLDSFWSRESGTAGSTL